MVSFAFCDFVFLQVKSDDVVMLIVGFDYAWHWMVSSYFLFLVFVNYFFNVVSKMSMMEHMRAILYEGDP